MAPGLIFLGVVVVSATQQTGFLLGPLFAGALAARLGMSAAFIASGALSLGGAMLFASIRTAQPASSEREPMLRELRMAVSLVLRDPVLSFVITLVGVIGLFVTNVQVLITALAQRTLHLGPDGYGFLMAGMGLGAVLGAVWVNLGGRKPPTMPLVLRYAMAISACTLALSVASAHLLPSVLLICGAGAAWALFQSSSLSLVQDRAPAAMRGKVLSIYALLSLGMTPIGYTMTGLVADSGGVGFASALDGGLGLAGCVGIAVSWRRALGGNSLQ